MGEEILQNNVPEYGTLEWIEERSTITHKRSNKWFLTVM